MFINLTPYTYPPLTTHVVTDGLISDGLWDIYNNKHMGTCGDLCATTYNISREAQDEFAIGSYEKAKAAWETPVSIRIVCILDVYSVYSV